MSEMERNRKLKRLRIFEYGLAAVLAGAMVALYFIGRARNMAPQQFSAQADLEMPGKVFVSRFEGGQLRLALKGRDLRYHQDTGTATLLKPKIEVRNEKGTVLVDAAQGRYQNAGGDVFLEDGVVIHYQDYQARTRSLVYNAKSEAAGGEDEIEIQGPGLDLRGKGYRFDLGKGEMELKNAVKGKFKKTEG